jgi:hypothetical protein
LIVENELVAGLYNSAEFKDPAPGKNPPQTNTFPFDNKVAV